jgi:PPOX class probable FMN-dependent enzyme
MDLGVTPVITRSHLRRALGGDSTSSGVNTIRRRLEDVDRRWLNRSCFCLMATAGADGSCDVSPRGDVPGFALVLDDTTLVLPERAGNRRGDGYANLLENPHVGLLFLIPGRNDTIRINGRGTLVSDGPFFDALAVGGVRPVLALLVAIEEVFYHCVKAFHRSGLWRPEQWDRDAAPSRGQVARALEADLPSHLGAAAHRDDDYAQQACAL